jgi:phosphatidylglycerophosphate synthase
MKQYSLDEIRSTQKGKGFYLKFSNEIATQIIYRIQVINIHPNYFTLISLFFGILFALFLVNGFTITSAIMVNLLYLFDNFDGQWARVKKMTSSFGALFDSLVDGWNISLVVVALGVYQFDKSENIIYIYMMSLFFILSFLDFALEKNNLLEAVETKSETNISFQENSSKLKPIILFVDSLFTYDKWILVITIGLILDRIDLVLIYLVFVRLLNYIVKLLKLYLRFK